MRIFLLTLFTCLSTCFARADSITEEEFTNCWDSGDVKFCAKKGIVSQHYVADVPDRNELEKLLKDKDVKWVLRSDGTMIIGKKICKLAPDAGSGVYVYPDCLGSRKFRHWSNRW